MKKFRFNSLLQNIYCQTIFFSIILICFFTISILAADEENTQNNFDKENPVKTEKVNNNTLFDKSHGFMANKLSELVRWFDNFFGDEIIEEEGPPESSLRWRNTFRFSEDDDFSYNTRVYANLRLPKISKKLRLIFYQEKGDDMSGILSDDPFETDSLLKKDENTGRAGLRYNFWYTPQSKFHVGAGVRLKIPPKPYVRLRYRHTFPFSKQSLGRFTETLFWREWEGFGETTRLDLERLLSPTTVIRWSSSGTFSEESSGIDWGSEIVMFHKLSTKTAISYGIGTIGITRPDTIAEDYKIWFRLRRNFYREWLYYELEPEVTWPRDENGGREPVYAFSIRIEIQF